MSSGLNISGAFAVFFLDFIFLNRFEQNTENANIFSVTSNTARNGHYISHCIEAGLISPCVVFTIGTNRKWMRKQKRARERPKKNWMEGIKKAMNERNLNEGQ